MEIWPLFVLCLTFSSSPAAFFVFSLEALVVGHMLHVRHDLLSKSVVDTFFFIDTSNFPHFHSFFLMRKLKTGEWKRAESQYILYKEQMVH